jgi:hypothetical protein
MKREALLTYWNPRLPTEELSGLHECIRRQLVADGYRSVGSLDHCPKEQLLSLGYSEKQVTQIRAALAGHRRFVEGIGAIFISEGLLPKQVKGSWPFDLLRLPFTCAQLGYVLRWQKDVIGRYGSTELFCVAGGRVYYCTDCRYRDERANFCGFCTRKLLDEQRGRKAGHEDGI